MLNDEKGPSFPSTVHSVSVAFHGHVGEECLMDIHVRLGSTAIGAGMVAVSTIIFAEARKSKPLIAATKLFSDFYQMLMNKSCL